MICVRLVVIDDVVLIVVIYVYYVLIGMVIFDIDLLLVLFWIDKIEILVVYGWLFFVVEVDGDVIGYVYVM